MKKAIYLVFILFAFCKSNVISNKKNYRVKQQKTYSVYKLDSLNSYYLIYVKRGDSLFKIVSRKTQQGNCNSIKVASNYELSLSPMHIQRKTVGNSQFQPVNHLDMGSRCKKFDDSTEVCIERYMDDLYTSDNISGRCLIKI